jgi:light-regulated signal transduction histidine kinase (bacteriophytochrome)
VFSLACVLAVAAEEGQLRHSIYVPGLATILLLANLTKRSQTMAYEAALAAERARLSEEAANRELEAFTYSVAHDLRTPLRGIDGFSLILLEDYGHVLDEAGQRHLQRVRELAQQMGRIIDGLLGLGRVTQRDMQNQWVDLSQLARETATRLRQSQPERAVEFVIGEGLRARGDSDLLGAAIENLLANAWKFTRGRADARIEFGAERENGHTTYFVRDNGAGFDMAFSAKLFGVFKRLHNDREFEGTGVGLATVQRIVNRHGGRVWGEGKVGEGACFRFTFGD